MSVGYDPMASNPPAGARGVDISNTDGSIASCLRTTSPRTTATSSPSTSGVQRSSVNGTLAKQRHFLTGPTHREPAHHNAAPALFALPLQQHEARSFDFAGLGVLAAVPCAKSASP